MIADELAPKILPIVLKNVTTAYPYHDVNFFAPGDPPHDPLAAHPAFGNGFDWHSSVHSHWTAIHLIEHFDRTGVDGGPALRSLERAIAKNLMPRAIERELAYFKTHASYERPYGWAWALMLAAYVPSMREFATWISQASIHWMTTLTLPVRHGVHSNTAFALELMLDAANALGFEELAFAIRDRARLWFESDRDWPAAYERSGNDFLSPGLSEATLMLSVLSHAEFATWWSAFAPAATRARLLDPVSVPRVDDGHIVHLHGLNLSRSAQCARIARALSDRSMSAQARLLYDASFGRAYEGGYTETHWLPTFAWRAAKALDAL